MPRVEIHTFLLFLSRSTLGSQILRETICHSCLTFVNLATQICQIEAIMNSRPITPLSTDTNDLSALTPNHFFIGSRLLAVPQTDFTDVPFNRLKHFERLQQII